MLTAEKRVLKKISFEDLPPRVIIYDILSFYEFIIGKEVNKFCLYGYFKLDRFRNIWLSFTSINFGDNRAYSSSIVFIRFSKLESISLFDIYLGSKQILEAIVEDSENMFRLRRLVLYHIPSFFPRDNDHVTSLDIFKKPSCFPALEEFYCDVRFNGRSSSRYDYARASIDTSKWSNRENPFSHLRNIRLMDLKGEIPSNFLTFQERNFQKNLNSVCLVMVTVPKDVSIELPNLRIIDLFGCKNICIYSKSLVSLRITNMESIYVRKIIRGTFHLKKLLLQNVEFSSSDNWFFDRNINPLTHLREIEFGYFQNFDPSLLDFETKWKPILHQLESVSLRKPSLSSVPFSPEIVQSLFLPLPKLNKVHLDGFSLNMNDLESEQKLKLNEFELLSSQMTKKTEDILFRTLLLQDLEILSLKMVLNDRNSLLRGNDYFQFHNLKKLKISSFLIGFDDTFFRQQNFRKLKVLEIDSLLCVTGTKWNENKVPGKFCSLKSITIRGCPKILVDALFVENDFPALEYLKLSYLPFVTGKGWEKKRSSILEVRVSGCGLFEE